jgi:ABC-type Zn uptake system ZnuABC Zn-binding protein ZnuA
MRGLTPTEFEMLKYIDAGMEPDREPTEGDVRAVRQLISHRRIKVVVVSCTCRGGYHEDVIITANGFEAMRLHKLAAQGVL